MMPSPPAVPSPPLVEALDPSAANGLDRGHGQPLDPAPPLETAGRATDASSPDEGARPDRGRDAITEGKQKAKAVLAAAAAASASSLSPAAAAADHDPPEDAPPAGTDDPPRLPAMPYRPRPTLPQLQLDQYVTRDHLHAVALHEQSVAQADLFRAKRREIEYYHGLRRDRRLNPAAVFGPGYAGYGNGHTDGPPRVVYPAQRRRPGGRRTRPLRLSRKDAAAQADQLEELVPVRLDVEWDRVKLRDTFTWNLHDRVVSPALFAEQLVEDFRVPAEQAPHVTQLVAQALAEQLQGFYPPIFIREEALDPHLPYHAYKNDEMRVLIKLNITIGQHNLVDQFEWEINHPLNSPEDFARQMTRDLSLSGEFTTAIAHSIREQCQLFTKSLYVTGHPFDGRPIEDPDLRDAFLPSPLPSVFRPAQHARDFTPYLWELNDAELDRTESSLSREQRRQKRSVNRRGGPALPDLKDRQRTVRTLVVSSVIPGATESLEESRLFKRVEGVAGRSGRRSGPGQRAGDDSDLSDSDESPPESPPAAAAASSTLITYHNPRTRGTRVAASAAQLAMRASTLGHSATPEPSLLHHHETRTSARRLGGRDVREESLGDGSTLIVKLRINRDRFRQFLQDGMVPVPVEPTTVPADVFAPAAHTPYGTPSARTGEPPPSTPSALPPPPPPPSSLPPAQQQPPPPPPHPHTRHPSISTNGYASTLPPGMLAAPPPNVPYQQIGAVDATEPGQPEVRLRRRTGSDFLCFLAVYHSIDLVEHLQSRDSSGLPGSGKTASGLDLIFHIGLSLAFCLFHPYLHPFPLSFETFHYLPPD